MAHKFVEANVFERTVINLKKLISAVKRFIELSDTPTTYSGDAERLVTVKSTEDGLEFGRRLFVSESSPTAGDGEVGDIWFEV